MRLPRFTSFLSLFLIISKIGLADTTNVKNLISQKISYTTSKAGEVYIVWGVDYFQGIADSIYWPKGSYKNRGMVYTKMDKADTIFSATFTLPEKTYINYMFWVPIDAKGDSTDGWDTYGEQYYSSDFSESKQSVIDDHALWLPEKVNEYDILSSGWQLGLIALLIGGGLIYIFRKTLKFSAINLILCFSFLSIVLAAVIRLQMNDLFSHWYEVMRVLYPDIIYYTGFAVCAILLLYITRKVKILNRIIAILLVLAMTGNLLFSLLNIQIVKQIGRPLNYQWLYYSNFLNGTDATNAVAYNFPRSLVVNLLCLVLGIFLCSLAYSFINIKKIVRFNIALSLLTLALIIVGFYKFRGNKTSLKTVKNPVVELVSSAWMTEATPQLFSMKVSDQVKKYFSDRKRNNSYQHNDSVEITNIVLFVLESTPKQFISVYDSTYAATPNMKSWMTSAEIYTNMYSHIPSTSSSMATMISGVYPLVSFKSIINEYPNNRIPSIAGELHQRGWTTSLFSSADLNFGNMQSYAADHNFTSTADSKTINCNRKRFEVTNTILDGLDDKCIIDRYFLWCDSNTSSRKFSMLWTNQMHYPYFSHS